MFGIPTLSVIVKNLIQNYCFDAYLFLSININGLIKCIERACGEERCNSQLLEEMKNAVQNALPLPYEVNSITHDKNKYLLTLTNKQSNIPTQIELPPQEVAEYSRYGQKELQATQLSFKRSLEEISNFLLGKNIGSYIFWKKNKKSKKYDNTQYLSFVNSQGEANHVCCLVNLIDNKINYLLAAKKKYNNIFDLLRGIIGNHTTYIDTSPNYIEKVSRQQPRIVLEYKNSMEITSDCVYLFEQEYGDTNPQAKNPLIGTYGFSTCIVIFIFNDKKSCVIHAKGNDDYIEESLNLIMEVTFGEKWNTNPSCFFVTLTGGLKSYTGKFAERIKKFFETNQIAYNTELLYQHTPLAIDSRTGYIVVGANPSSNHIVMPNRERHTNEEIKKRETIEKKGVKNLFGDFYIKRIANGEIININCETILYHQTEKWSHSRSFHSKHR